ncbi:hypothetical protein N0B31_10260 [Salinirubellus salinus]|uniref:Uncharacterized protein n=1 Tax=Salinirubellus salinus TaxID=1364945 RepID=A0A9E7UCV7_9EURY|nr:hypothetical protein [Salinirubellus salinus]UWM56658.1 hypothetical protein N0B31_10260 [Salinirubellus salinus]
MSQKTNSKDEEPQTIEISLSALREAFRQKWDNPHKYGRYEDLAKYVTWCDDNPAETVKLTTQETGLHTRGWTRIRIDNLVQTRKLPTHFSHGVRWDEARQATLEHGSEDPEDDDFEAVVREGMEMARDEAWYTIKQNLVTTPRGWPTCDEIRFEYVDDE